MRFRIGIILFIIECTCLSCTVDDVTIIQGQHYIAHAGGSIDGIRYTNSKEAVENAISLGIEYIELDLSLTADSELVAVHDWEMYNEIVYGDKYLPVPTYEQFKQTKLFGKYTPLTYCEIDSIWRANKQLYLVIDKISDPQLLGKYFQDWRDRVIVEAFSVEDYETLREMGFCMTMLSTRPPEKGNGSISKPSFYVFEGYSLESNAYQTKDGDGFAVFFLHNVTQKEADMVFQQDERIKFVYVDQL